MRGIDVGFFLGVLYQVEQVGRLQVLGAVVGLDFPDEVHFPVAPFRRAHFGLDVIDETLACGLFLPSAQKIRLVQAVDGPIRRNGRPRNTCQRREEIHYVHDFVRLPSRGNASGPACDAGHAQCTFHGRVISAGPHARAAAPGAAILGAVVAGKDEKRIVTQAECGYRVRDLSYARIHLDQRVREVAFLRQTFEFTIWKRRKVQLSERHVEKERFSAVGLAADEITTAPRQFGVDAASHFKIV